MDLKTELSKRERTRKFIIETVAPIFNKKGYAGTSMSDLTEATGLTKGSIYGNFENKEELALEAFNYSFRRIIKAINKAVLAKSNAVERLMEITRFYRNYYNYVIDAGGCPILNVGVDTHHENPLLFERSRQVMNKLLENIEFIFTEGMAKNEIKANVDSKKYASLILAQIEGGIFVSVMNKDPYYLNVILDQMDEMINREIKP